MKALQIFLGEEGLISAPPDVVWSLLFPLVLDPLRMGSLPFRVWMDVCNACENQPALRRTIHLLLPAFPFPLVISASLLPPEIILSQDTYYDNTCF